MKKIFATLSAVLVLASSCTDFLDVKPRGYDIASKLEHYEGLLYGTDLCMLYESFPYMSMECYTDEDGYGNAYSTAGSYVCNGYKWEKDIYREDQQCGEWNSFSTILYNCNLIIAEVLDAEDGTQEQKLAVQSEARMLRAWCTFMMSSFFGNVPIITKASTMDNDFPLSSEEEVKSFVLKEMEESVGNLKDAEEHYLRIFKTTGYALYGKVLFMYKEYDKAQAALEECFELLKEQSSVCLVNYPSLMEDDGEIDFPTRADANPEKSLYFFSAMPRLWDSVYASLYSMLMFGVRNDLLEYFFPDKHDCRLAFLSSVSSGKTAYKTYKSKDVYAANMSSITTNIAVDLSEVYTMYAECLARSGETDAATKVLLELRRNRMDAGHEAIPSDVVSKDDFIRFAFAERMREEFGFGTSWFDMKRVWDDPLFQDLKPKYVHTLGSETYTLTEDRLYLAYPPSVLKWHPEYSNND